MIYLLPYINYKIESPTTKNTILQNFYNSISLLKALPVRKVASNKDFEGVIKDDDLRIRRSLKVGYSAFLPISNIKISNENGGTNLHVVISFHRLVNIGIILYYLFQFSLLTFTFDFIATFIVLPYLVLIILFNLEVPALKNKIKDLVDSA